MAAILNIPELRIGSRAGDAHGGRDHDAFNGEERRPLVLPIELK
jgi:hypothetical protein